MVVTAATFKIHAELLVRAGTDVAQLLTHYEGVGYLNLPRRPQIEGRNCVLVPKEAGAKITSARSLDLYPHIVGYDYTGREGLEHDLEHFYRQGVRQALFIKGDPFSPLRDRTFTTLEMLAAARDFNRRNPIEIAVGGQMPQGEKNIQHELDYLEQKIDAGAQVVLTQPVHSLSAFHHYCELLRQSGLHEQASFRPGVALWGGARNAWFWSHLLEGVEVPLSDLWRLALARDKENAGVEIAKQKIKAVVDAGIFGGIYLMPFNRQGIKHLPALARYARGLITPTP